jgi:hypothetical protein
MFFVLQHMILWVLKLLGISVGLFWDLVVQDLGGINISRFVNFNLSCMALEGRTKMNCFY